MERPSFFKVMIGDTFRITLGIPPNFMKHLGERINKRSVLRSSGGRQWEIKIGIVDGQLFFQDGWESFVSDHSISVGDFLVFFYGGDGGFYVKIYGTTGCEKQECIPVPTAKIEVESDDSEEEQHEHVSPHVTRKRKAVTVEEKGNGKRSTQSCVFLQDSSSSLCDDLQELAHFLHGERLLTEDNNERVLNAAKSVESRNPKA